VQQGEDDIGGEGGEGGVRHAQPGNPPREVGEAILNLGPGKCGGELHVEALGGHIGEAVHRHRREAKDLNQEIGEVLVRGWDVLGVKTRAQGREIGP
jgi:hypothetical protein